MIKIMLATQNNHKLKEFQTLLKPNNYQPFLPSKKFEVLETGLTFSANAILKAKAFGRFFNVPVMADDSGLCIDYLNGQPGIHSHRYAVNGFPAARLKILKLMRQLPQSQRSARFICSLAFFHPLTKACRVFTGQAEGFISRTEMGHRGFGYDSIFVSRDLNKTFAQATFAEKNQFSHRAKALKKLLIFLKLSTIPQ